MAFVNPNYQTIGIETQYLKDCRMDTNLISECTIPFASLNGLLSGIALSLMDSRMVKGVKG